jgi:uncharacterized protein YneF (UPF0154 family)
MKGRNKRILYLTLWIITGILLGILIGALIEYEYLYLDITEFSKIFIYSPSLLAGIAFGFWIGPKAWTKIYIEGARGKKYIIK